MMPELSMHLMDIIENSVSAGARIVDLYIEVDSVKDTLTLTVIDDGKGMSGEMLEKAVEPLFSTKKGKNWGLGLPLFKQTAEHCDGEFKIISEEGKYTEVIASLKFSHIDRPPVGNIEDTVISIIVGHPAIDFYVCIKWDEHTYEFDTRIVREALGGLGSELYLGDPEVLSVLGNDIKEGLKEICWQE